MSHHLDQSEHFLTVAEEKLLLTIARDALEAVLGDGRAIDPHRYPLTASLRAPHGAFVTLRADGDLRGCIGAIRNTIPLAQAVAENAVNAATRDPRFAQVTYDELDAITIEISALTYGDTPDTPFRRVHDLSEITIGRDGLYIEKHPFRGGLLLPQVAIEQNWTREQFLSAVCRKAGYADRSWEQQGTNLYRFSAQVFSECNGPANGNRC